IKQRSAEVVIRSGLKVDAVYAKFEAKLKAMPEQEIKKLSTQDRFNLINQIELEMVASQIATLQDSKKWDEFVLKTETIESYPELSEEQLLLAQSANARLDRILSG